MTQAPAIELQAVSLTLGEHCIFDRLTLSMESAQWHSILGRSGAGKSCLLRLVAGLQQPDSGCITSFGKPSASRQIAYMAQEDGLLPWLSNLDNVQLGARLRGERSPANRQRAQALIEQVGLADWADALPAVLSGGMRQRIALARTLFEDQPVVLMDEPFSRLDAITRDELQLLAFDLLSKRTVLLVTHDPIEALRLSQAVHVLSAASPSSIHSIRLSTAAPRAMDDAYVMQHLPTVWHHLQSLSRQVDAA
ncbi:ABC transporter ATP-binding protein [Granulosicoccus antarcticus]|uniref:Aliphatic sulfonates import ATP-binding protein SsuB n=1 Tax=Granulosicoccus antarcticus IMCC3135 TaxID=1192854 RepID=A0A2Z2NRH6_9GAMM|nr:ABC transporter ATP-binding protein [Granulosicoccus antarcticus]ASJ74052.1 Aliphatic sulfonates import ATP-binding protein SsuB [Granulosicoccus antarcticus IMCC3135]